MTFGLVTFEVDGVARVGVQTGDRVADATEVLAGLLGAAPAMLAVLEQWDAALPRLQELAHGVAAGRVATRPLAAVRLRAPLPRPVNLYCAFANYVDHMREMGDTPADKSVEDPFQFMVPVTVVTDPGAPIPIPTDGACVDWEGELAAVIGRPAHGLTPDQALACVAGYTIVHDVSIRIGARRGQNGGRPDFLSSKGRAGFKPMGPAIIPATFIPDPQALRLRTTVNGVVKQDSSTAQMIFTTAELIAQVSRLVGVVPGDVFATGTPAGVGMPRREFLKPGDIVAIEIEGVGTLTNPVAAA